MKFKKIIVTTLAVATTILATTAKADYGCEAVLCFAGGTRVAECQPTIKRVLRDIAKGRGFPVCIGSDNNITGNYAVEVHQNNNPKFVCPDKKTRPFLTLGNDNHIKHYCRKITINVPKDMALDEKHQRQTYYIDE